MSLLCLISFYFLDPLFAQVIPTQTKSFDIDQAPCLSINTRTILKKSLLVYENLEKFGKFILWFKKNPLFFESYHVFEQEANNLYLQSFSFIDLQVSNEQKKHQKQCISLKIKKIKRACEIQSENQKRQVLTAILQICVNPNTQKIDQRFESCHSLGHEAKNEAKNEANEDLWIVSNDLKTFQAYRTDHITQKTCDDLSIHSNLTDIFSAYQQIMTYQIIEQTDQNTRILLQKDPQAQQDQILLQSDVFENDQLPRYHYHAQNQMLKDIYGEINQSSNHQNIHLITHHVGDISKHHFQTKSEIDDLVKEDFSIHAVNQTLWLSFWIKLSEDLLKQMILIQQQPESNTPAQLKSQIKQMTQNLAYLLPPDDLSTLPKIELKVQPFQYQQDLLQIIQPVSQ